MAIECRDCGEEITVHEDSYRATCVCGTSWRVEIVMVPRVRLYDPVRPDDLTDDDRRDTAAGR